MDLGDGVYKQPDVSMGIITVDIQMSIRLGKFLGVHPS